MDKIEIINELSSRYLNSKTNNLIITNVVSFDIVDRIPDTCKIMIRDYDLDNDTAFNIKIDLNEVDVGDILSYILNELKKLKLIDTYFDYEIKFNNKLDILKFQGVLRNYNIIVQIIFKNVEKLNLEEQKLFNELYYFNSIFFNMISFVRENFITYFLTNDRVLDNRENYEKIELTKSTIKEIYERKAKRIYPKKNVISVIKTIDRTSIVELNKTIEDKIKQNRKEHQDSIEIISKDDSIYSKDNCNNVNSFQKIKKR